MKMNGDILENFKVKNAPETVYYIPNFISEFEEQHIIEKVNNVPKPKWTCLKNRRLQDYGGVPHKNGMIVEPIPSWLQTYMDKVSDLKIFGDKRANHVLINEYLPGQGIMPHLDGPLFYPTVSTITCGSHTILEFLTNENEHREKVCQLLLERCSLVILKDDMYEKYLHSINEMKEDIISSKCANLDMCSKVFQDEEPHPRDTRLSLTIRNVPKIAKINLFSKLKIK